MNSPITISGYPELVAAVPHLLGFTPTDSVVCIPIGAPGPIARIDHPHNDSDVVGRVKGLSDCYLRASTRALAVVAITDDRAAAVKTAAALTHVLRDKVSIATALWVDQNNWTDLATGISGTVSEQSATRIAAEAVLRGQALPAASREDLARALHGDSTAVAALLPAADQHAESIASASDLENEKAWITDTIGRFLKHQRPLNDAAAARMLIAMQTLELRDCAWEAITRQDARSHVALWHDLTRRAPESARTPAAALLGFSSWLSGHGAQAWVALDLIPESENYTLARLVSAALEAAVPPPAWDPQLATNSISRSLLQYAHLNTSPASTRRPQPPRPGGRSRPAPPAR